MAARYRSRRRNAAPGAARVAAGAVAAVRSSRRSRGVRLLELTAIMDPPSRGPDDDQRDDHHHHGRAPRPAPRRSRRCPAGTPGRRCAGQKKSVEPTGPPTSPAPPKSLGEVETTNACAKYWKALIMPSIRLKKMVGVSSGRVTCQKRLAGLGAVERRRLVQLFRHILQAGQEDDHGGARAPDALEQQARLGPARVGEPAGLRQVQPAQVSG